MLAVMPDSIYLKTGLGLEALSGSLSVFEQNCTLLNVLRKAYQLNSTITAVGSCGNVAAIGMYRKI